MTYRIQILVRDDAERPLWTYYMTTLEGATTKTIWETTDTTVLDSKMEELLKTHTVNSLEVVGKINYSIDVVIA